MWVSAGEDTEPGPDVTHGEQSRSGTGREPAGAGCSLAAPSRDRGASTRLFSPSRPGLLTGVSAGGRAGMRGPCSWAVFTKVQVRPPGSGSRGGFCWAADSFHS